MQLSEGEGRAGGSGLQHERPPCRGGRRQVGAGAHVDAEGEAYLERESVCVWVRRTSDRVLTCLRMDLSTNDAPDKTRSLSLLNTLALSAAPIGIFRGSNTSAKRRETQRTHDGVVVQLVHDSFRSPFTSQLQPDDTAGRRSVATASHRITGVLLLPWARLVWDPPSAAASRVARVAARVQGIHR